MNLKRTITYALLVLILLAAGGLFGAGWYYSGVLKDGAMTVNHDPPVLDLEVVTVDEDAITLRAMPDAEADWTKPGTWGLEGEDSYDQVGEILEQRENQVVRQFMPVDGATRMGDRVRLEKWAFPENPMTSFGIPYEEVMYTSPLGDFPAWYVDGPRDTWAIFVHGQGSEPAQVLRLLPALVDLGFPTLAITYRNDEGLPPDPSGYYRWGSTEWEDLEGAVRYSLDNGAEEVLLLGYSMGGGIVVSFLRRSELAEHVRGVVLDAPVLNLDAAVDLGARRRNLPGFLTFVGKTISGWRFDIDWRDWDNTRARDDLTVPILLVHGDDDDRAPIKVSRALAEAHPDIVTYAEFPGAVHVASWNVDPERYEALLREFLGQF